MTEVKRKEEVMKEKKKFEFSIHYVFGIILIAIITVCIVKLIQWNRSTTEVDLNVAEGAFDMECLDFYVYPDEEARAKVPDDGVEDIVVFGNDYVNNNGKKHSIINKMREGMPDANIIDLSVDNSKLGCFRDYLTCGLDAFGFYHLIYQHDTGNYKYLDMSSWEEGFTDKDRYKKFIENYKNLDFNKVDTVVIMYSLYDYYNSGITIFADEHNPYGYHGALLSAVEMLQKKYPHLNIVISSFTPEYYETDDGEMQLSLETDYGWGTSSVYFDIQYAVATRQCVSFIDNYFYAINEKNITEYLNGMTLTDKGIDLIGDHVVEFLSR